MIQFLLVGIGGALGAMARFGAGRLIGVSPDGWPMATFTVNVAGGLLMGLLSAVLLRLGDGEGWRLFLGVGVLGGFTTFSSFSLELLLLFERGRTMLATGYALSSVLAAFLAIMVGMWLGRLFA